MRRVRREAATTTTSRPCRPTGIWTSPASECEFDPGSSAVADWRCDGSCRGHDPSEPCREDAGHATQQQVDLGPVEAVVEDGDDGNTEDAERKGQVELGGHPKAKASTQHPQRHA